MFDFINKCFKPICPAPSEWRWDTLSDAELNPWKIPDPKTDDLIKEWKEKGFKRYLDLGAGIGRHTVPFIHAGFDVRAYDINASGLCILKNQLMRENIKFHPDVCYTSNLQYPSGFFDIAMAMHILSLADWDGMKQNIAELHRVMAIGGEAYLTLDSKESAVYKLKSSIKLDKHSRKLRCGGGPDNNAVHCFVDKKMIPDLLNGFTIIDIQHKIDLPRLSGLYFYVHVKKTAMR